MRAPRKIPPDAEVTVKGLTKYFGDNKVLDNVSFTAPAGKVTGFVGANGAGKTTTLRILLGLVKPSAGEARIAGRYYRELNDPRHLIGAVLNGPGGHPGQTGRSYLRILAAAAGICDCRVGEVLELVELSFAAKRRIGGYSLGMRQRLALAGALLADPPILVLDEPANGLDPIGIRWIRGFLRDLAGEGRCVLVSSHQLSELEATADRIVMINDGQIIAEMDMSDALTYQDQKVIVRTKEPERLAALVEPLGGKTDLVDGQELIIRGLNAERIGEIAAAAGIVLYSLGESRVGLEEMFLKLAANDPVLTSTGNSTKVATRGES